MHLGEKIQQLRKAGGLSQEQLAEKLGVSRQSVSKWESGQSLPEIDKIIQISSLFSVSTDSLLKEESVSESSFPSGIEEISRKNFKRKQVMGGISITVLGLVALILEFASLKLLQYLDSQTNSSFTSDPYILNYMKEPPMSIVVIITAIIIIIGVLMTIAGVYSKNEKK